jgi:hypothetical protein
MDKNAVLKNSGGSLWFDAETPPRAFRPYALTRAPLSAARPDLGCSLPSLAGFAWWTVKAASLRKLLIDRQPQGTDSHWFGKEGLSDL